jgi:osmotically-inducible protein OsmY
MHRPNNLVESDIRESIDYDPRLNDSRIIVKAHDGRVTLSGTVDTFPERDLAERDARYAIGVKAIDNQLVVGLVGDAIADLDIAAAAREALDRDRVVKVSNRGHTIYLDGVVNSWDAMDTALDTAWSAPGVRQVVNNLTLIE